MSLYLPGTRQFHPCHRYCIITVISPNWPPTSSWSLAAKSASGRSGLAWNCSSLLWRYMGPPEVGNRMRRPRCRGDVAGTWARQADAAWSLRPTHGGKPVPDASPPRMRGPPRVTGEHVRERGADGAGTASGPRLHVLGDLEV